MFRMRRLGPMPGKEPGPAAEDLIREAEAIVHGSWLNHLAERRHEMEAALRRAAARCDVAQRSLIAAQRSDDPQMIATSREDLEKARTAARKTLLAWERVSQVLAFEAGLSPTAAPDSTATANIPDDSAPLLTAATASARGGSRCRGWVQRVAAPFKRLWPPVPP